MHIMPAVLSVLAMTMPAVAHAQAGQWELLRANSGAPFGRVAGNGSIARLSLSCSGGDIIMLLTLRRSPPRSPARLTLTIGNQSAQVPIQRTVNPAVWGTVFSDGRVADLISAGRQAGIAIDGAAFGGVPLAGAGAVMRSALKGCWRAASGGAIAARPPAPSIVPSMAPSDAGATLAGMQARNFPPAIMTAYKVYAAQCARVGGRLSISSDPLSADFNQDGVADYVLSSDGMDCSGAESLFSAGSRGDNHDVYLSNGKTYAPVSGRLIAGGEKKIVTRGDRPMLQVLTRDEFEYWGWNGKAFTVMSRSTGDQPVTQAPKPTASGTGRNFKALPAKPAASGRGPLSRIPMQLGYYVPAGDTCRRPSSLMKFEADGYWMIDDEGAFKERIASVRSEQGAYVLLFADVPPSSSDDLVEPVSQIIVTPEGRGRILVQINGDGYMNFCNESDIPQNFKK